MVEFTYQDYLTYQKYVENKKDKEKKVSDKSIVDEKIKEGEVKEAMVTLAERLQKNDERILQEGITQGIAKGVKQTMKKIVERMLGMGMEEKDIQEATGLTKEEIQDFKK